MLASSALTGSSHSSSRGPAASALAIETRCRWPPEICPGVPVAQRGVEAHLREGVVDLLADLPRVEAAADSEPLADDLRDGQVGVERAQRVLEDELDVPAAALPPARAAAQPGDLGSREDDPALPRPYQADDGPGQGGLARAGLADQADDLAGPDIEVDAGQHLAGAPAVAEDYIDTRDGEQRGRGRRRGSVTWAVIGRPIRLIPRRP